MIKANPFFLNQKLYQHCVSNINILSCLLVLFIVPPTIHHNCCDHHCLLMDSKKSHVSLTENPLSVDEAYQFLQHPSCGAVYLFIGTVRKDEFDDERNIVAQVDSIDYDAYDSMAVKVMGNIVEAAFSKFNIHRCYTAHRKGLIKVMEASILIGCSSAHREASFEATFFILNEIKKSVPIWKKIALGSSNNPSRSSGSHWSDKSEAFWLK